MEIVSNIALISINATMFHQLIAFLVFLFIINRIMFRPLRSVMGERESFMEKIRLDTVDATKEFEKLTATLKAKESAVRAEAQDVRCAIEEQGGREAGEILESARQEISSIKAKVETEVNAQIAQARKKLRQEAETLAVNIMEKMLDRRLGS
ncbi:MAG: ATP synthase F0 subunit B [Desulfobacteraceae bacterium]|uniref:ATP synthase subunit b n=1 Tax=Candidatus Desulfatibia vada TaxID=2841696 RepID=A0A8J6P502_9BACT|nr:ATP synthase F0 subunit B [Candidatus Desulfatibia vada]NQT68967.1 ATP synthase F0 subunit B [Desulfobacteraceae bacterium]